MSTYLFQLSDLHIREPGRVAYGRIDTASFLRAAIESIAQCPQAPSALVITGDLCDFGREQEYVHLRELLADIRCPIYLLPGNHDCLSSLRLVFPEHDYLGASGPAHYSVAVGDLQLIALDSTVPGQSFGAIDQEAIAWLHDALKACGDRPVVLAMHHPPFLTQIGHMDEIGLLLGRAELAQLLGQFCNVERIICGHLHRAIETRFAGTIASTAPSPAHQVVLDLNPQAVSRWNLEPGGFRIHAWSKSAGLVTHNMPVGKFEGPYPFHAEAALIG
ncbi:MAG: phosphodiesterase [Betaproteobacteria bacterium]|nr:phosphodiesterase [Betaproteobacteria bacterium]